MSVDEEIVEEIRKEHGPTPGDDHCSCGVRFGVGCWVGDLLTAYAAMKAERDDLQKQLDIDSENRRELWAALAFIREALEELGPVGGTPRGGEYTPGPMDEAEALVAGVLTLSDARGAALKRAEGGRNSQRHLLVALTT